MTRPDEPRPHALAIQDTARWLYEHRARLPQFVIYDHPRDYPDYFVARLWFALPERPEPQAFAIMDRTLERLQTTMEALGLVKLDRSPEDDPAILETWT